MFESIDPALNKPDFKESYESDMTPGAVIIISLLDRLFWLITQTPGVSRYNSDITRFTSAKVSAGLMTKAEADELYQRTFSKEELR